MEQVTDYIKPRAYKDSEIYHYPTVELHFKDSTHEYWKIVDGKRIDLNSASQLNGFNKHWYAQSCMKQDILAKGIAKGVAFHKMVEQYLKTGKYDLIGSKTLQARIPVFIKWLDSFLVNKVVLLVEQPLCAREMPIAGTPDLVVWDKIEQCHIILDWKSGERPVYYSENNPKRNMEWELKTRFEPQLRFYGVLLWENFILDINDIKLKIVWLEKSGDVKSHSFDFKK